MKAIVKKEAKRGGLVFEEVPMPSINDNELLIKIEKTSICGTDVHLYLWDEWAQKTLPVPSIIGHEFFGRVYQIGSKVQGFKVGDRVSGEGHITCGRCRFCLTGQRVLCPHTLGIGVNRHGCFAQYLALPAENVFLVPDQVPDEIASIFDPLGNAVHSALSFDMVGKNVLITGAGPIGIMSIAICKMIGAKNIVITDINEYRLALARQMKPTRVVNIATENLTNIKEEMNLDGFDISLEMSGSAQAFASLPEHTAHGGKIVLLGILPESVSLNWHAVIFKMLTIKGIYGREIFRTWFQMAHLIESGLDVSQVITHRFSCEEFEKGFEAMLSGKSGKVVLDWTNKEF